MSERTDAGEWRTTTDHDRIEEWAAARDAVPVLFDRRETEPRLRIAGHEDDVRDERISWDRFFDLFEEQGLAFRYREREPGREAEDDYGLIDRSAAERGAERTRVDREAAEPREDRSSEGEPDVPRTAESGPDQIATSDTGDREPVAYEPSESGPSGADDGDGPSETPASESARGSVEREDIVVDEIHEHPLGPDRWREGDEYVVFENVSEGTIDLSGWIVENGAGQAYRFDGRTPLEPGEQLVLHSGEGEDAERERYWGSDEPIWQTAGDTVVLRTPSGLRVVEESYKGGR